MLPLKIKLNNIMTSSGQADTNTGYIIFLSVASAIGGILFGYDTAVISGTIGSVTQQFSLDTMQQGWYVGCALIGSIIGALGKALSPRRLERLLRVFRDALHLLEDMQVVRIFKFHIAVDL